MIHVHAERREATTDPAPVVRMPQRRPRTGRRVSVKGLNAFTACWAP